MESLFAIKKYSFKRQTDKLNRFYLTHCPLIVEETILGHIC